ncbi:protein-export membrane protein SecF [Boudabousia tangfeifanii]|uniref:Protein-export membrane protein SecF n=1 Tax=Boudabousia tangfeifanii TaxID=1912795 RepID=A0A1D9MK41_9ACTO|nr:protein translocase subunit SecF [Boudabousia tangfeifanii]AOZ72652.1 protein-export membrane protein SecF [Boudabousia tangfeifanii]
MLSLSTLGRQLHSGERSFNVIGLRKVFISISAACIIISVLAVSILGLNPAIEFRGGSEFTISQVQNTSQQPAYDALKADKLDEGARVSNVGLDGIRVQTHSLSSEETTKVASDLAKAYNVDKDKITSTFVGPTWGAGVTKKALTSLAIFLVFVSLLMTFYFRNWRMALSALVALLNDMALLAGFFAITRVEISPATVIGFLTILAYSLYDTVVVFDKVRELTKNYDGQYRYTYGELVNLAVNQTFVRSINTSIVALLPVGSILVIGTWLLGAGTLLDISLALFVGMIAGAFSSLFIASPILTVMNDRTEAGKAHNEAVLKRRNGNSNEADEDGAEGKTGAPVKVAPLQAGGHRGQLAQPKRKPRSKR